MIRLPPGLAMAFLATLLVVPAPQGPAADRPTCSSPLALAASPEPGLVFVADATANSIRVVEVATRRVRRSVAIPFSPTGITVTPDGAVVYVTGSTPDGAVHALDPADGSLRRVVRVGHTPVAPVLSSDGGTLYVCDRFADDVVVVDLTAGAVTARIPVTREPVAAALTADGGLLLVANHLPGAAASDGYLAAGISLIDTALGEVAAFVQLPDGSTSLRGICLSPDGRHAYVSHVLARYHLPTTQLDRGWVNTNAISVLSVGERALVATVLVDDLDLGAADPWGIACSADGRWLAVAHAGTHELSVIDRPALHAKLARAHDAEVADDLTFLIDIRRRIALGGKGPRGLAVVGDEVWAAEYFSGSVGVVALAAEQSLPAGSVPLVAGNTPSRERRGELLFHDANASFQCWLSCATCHPDGRSDALTWDLLNDGLGNPKNTKSMLLAHATPPAMSTGIRPRAETAVRAGVRHIQFAVLSEEDAGAIDVYLASLKPVPSPRLTDGRINPVAERGSAVFERIGCAVCHPAPLYTDLELHDVGTAAGREEGSPLDTPTLVEAWRTAPYLYDGSAATLRESIQRHRYRGSDAIAGLSEADLRALVEFVASL